MPVLRSSGWDPAQCLRYPPAVIHRVCHARAWNVTDVFLGTLTALHTAVAGPAPFIQDRRLKLVPATGGFQLPDFYHWLLLPFSRRQVR